MTFHFSNREIIGNDDGTIEDNKIPLTVMFLGEPVTIPAGRYQRAENGIVVTDRKVTDMLRVVKVRVGTGSRKKGDGRFKQSFPLRR
jgi:hypothetical protein